VTTNWDDPVTEDYDNDVEFRLTKHNAQGFQWGTPEHAYICYRCGAVVVLRSVHDAFHGSAE
jgi:hypothetical protein